MTRISFVEFLCIVAIGVAMLELPGHRFIWEAQATMHEVNVRPIPQEKK